MDFYLPPKPAIIIPAREVIKPAIQRGNMFFCPPPFMRATAAATPISNSFLQAGIDTANLTTYTFTAANIGTAHATRRVVVSFHGNRAGVTAITPVSSVTIGGVAATVHATSTGASNDVVVIASALVPTGTTANIVIVWNSQAARTAYAAWRQINESVSTPNANQTDNTVSANVLSVAVNVPANGSLYAATTCSAAAAATFTWSGATERVDQTIEGGAVYTQGASSETGLSLQAGRTVQVTISSTSQTGGLAVLTWA